MFLVWKLDEPALYRLLQVIDKDAEKDMFSRYPCSMFVMGLQVEYVLLTF